jgi:hypothetical protein
MAIAMNIGALLGAIALLAATLSIRTPRKDG